jgi:hypothetical protein
LPLISHPLYCYKQKALKNKYSKYFGDQFQLTVWGYNRISIKQRLVIGGTMYVKQGFLLRGHRKVTTKKQSPRGIEFF